MWGSSLKRIIGLRVIIACERANSERLSATTLRKIGDEQVPKWIFSLTPPSGGCRWCCCRLGAVSTGLRSERTLLKQLETMRGTPTHLDESRCYERKQ